MIENKNMFTQDAINGAKCNLESKGLLNPQKEKQTSLLNPIKTNNMTP